MSYLMVRPLLGTVDVIQLWVGAFGYHTAPALSFTLGKNPVTPGTDSPPLSPIRDDTFLNSNPVNFQGIFSFPVSKPDTPHKFIVQANPGGNTCALEVKSLPAKVPSMGGAFKIMLLSCYSVDMDEVGVGEFIANMSEKPDMTLFAGDQVYIDHPPLKPMPDTALGLRQNISAKYQRNWLSVHTNQKGLQNALTRAPSVCLPDDHEFWNNYPWTQFWKNGTAPSPTPTGRNDWDDAARELFEDFQQGGLPKTYQPWTTLDIEPLCMLFLDTRSQREDNFDSPTGLMPASAGLALKAWEQKLLTHQAAGKPRIGVLATGQTLFCEPAYFKKVADAELANYETQFADIMSVLDNLGTQGIQVVFLTGDVHWSRVAQARHVRTGRITLTEVICSPSSQCLTPGIDGTKKFLNGVKGIFGKDVLWPRHSDPELPPDFIGKKTQFRPIRPINDQKDDVCGRRGNYVAMIALTRAGTGVSMTVKYYPILKSSQLPDMTCTYSLVNTYL